jgi:hypothetical protein
MYFRGQVVSPQEVRHVQTFHPAVTCIALKST